MGHNKEVTSQFPWGRQAIHLLKFLKLDIFLKMTPKWNNQKKKKKKTLASWNCVSNLGTPSKNSLPTLASHSVEDLDMKFCFPGLGGNP